VSISLLADSLLPLRNGMVVGNRRIFASVHQNGSDTRLASNYA
jgi:hypothetical protein